MVNTTQNKSGESGPACIVCWKRSLKRCSNCHEANYCSSDHQRQDWKEHKKVCLPYKLCKSKELGLHLVAMRDLDEKAVIIQEAALAVGPYSSDDPSLTSIHSDPICFGCCVRMSTASTRRCGKCHWPVCSADCEKLKDHAENECILFEENKINFPPKKSEAVYTSVHVLRLIFQKQGNPSQWKKLLGLKHHEKLRKHLRRYEREVEMVVENLVEFVTSEDRLYEMVGKEELLQVTEKVLLSPFWLSRREDGKGDFTFVRGIYVKAGLASYACIPNSVWSLSSSPNFQMTLQASVGIKRGQVIQFALSKDWVFQGTYQRQVHAFDDNKFSCKCSRCVDPTEFATYLSAIKCTNCSRGYLLPRNPVDLNAEAFWQCTDNTCSQLEEQEKIMSILHYFQLDMSKAIAAIQLEHPNNLPLNTFKKLHKLDELITLYSESRLHHNHFIILCLEQEFIQEAFLHLHSLRLQHLDGLIFHSQHLLNISEILTPGFNSHLAMLRNCLGQGMLQKRTKAAKEGQTQQVFGSPVALLDFLSRLDKLQKKSLEFYESDPPTSGVTTTSAILKKLLEDNAIVIRDIKSTTANLLK